MESLAPNTLVMYENDGTPLLGCVLGVKKNRQVIFNQRGREIELPIDRLHCLPGTIPSNITGAAARAAFLEQLIAKAESLAPNLAELWETLQSEGGEYTTTNLSELVYGKDTLVEHLAMRLALLRDKLYFRRDRHTFAPRTPEHVTELSKAEDARNRRIRAREAFINWIKQRQNDSNLILPSEAFEHLAALESIAVGRQDLEPTRQRESHELIELCASALKLDGRAHPSNCAYKILERCSHFSPLTNPIKVREQFPIDFSSQALEQAIELKSSLQVKLDQNFRDLRALSCFTIDDSSTQDMDDALSIKVESGLIRVGIHISNVAALIPADTALDHDASARATSLYLPEGTYNMFPDLIATDLASLIPNEARYAISLLADFDSSGRLLHHELCESVIKSSKRLSYDQVDHLLEQGDPDLNQLAEVAAALEAQRLEAGANQVQKRDVLPIVDSNGRVTLSEYDETSAARRLVGEMMILFNRVVAEFAQERSLPFIYRAQEAPEQEALPAIPAGPALDFQKRFRLKRSVMTFQPGFHSGLGLNAYAQVSSPIRRYLDLILLRQIIATLRNQQAPLDQVRLHNLIDPLEQRLNTAQIVSRASKRYWLIKFLDQLTREQRELSGVLVRHDSRVSLLELDNCAFTVMVRVPPTVQLGERLIVRLLHADALSDSLKFEFVRSDGVPAESSNATSL